MSDDNGKTMVIVFGTFLACCGAFGIILGNIGFIGLLFIAGGIALIVHANK